MEKIKTAIRWNCGLLGVSRNSRRSIIQYFYKKVNNRLPGFSPYLTATYGASFGGRTDEERPIGVWGQRQLHYLKYHRKVLYYNLLTSGKLHSHLADVEEQAQDLFSRLVKEYAEREGVTEQLKATDQMKWVQRMNNIRERVIETVYSDVVYV